MDEDGIDPGLGDRDDGLGQFLQLASEDEGVQRDITEYPAAVEHRHEGGQLVGGKIVGPGPGVETCIESEIDGVGPVFDRGLGAIPVAGGGEQFRGAPGRVRPGRGYRN